MSESLEEVKSIDDVSSPFKLSYIEFDPARYDELLIEKCNKFISSLLAIEDSVSISRKNKILLERLVGNSQNYKYCWLQNYQTKNYLKFPFFSVIPSPKVFCRQRVRFQIKPVKGNEEELEYIMWEHGVPSVSVKQFPIASKIINMLMAPLLGLVAQNPLLRGGLEGINYLSSTLNQVVVTLIYSPENLLSDLASLKPLMEKILQEKQQTEALATLEQLYSAVEQPEDEKAERLLQFFVDTLLIQPLLSAPGLQGELKKLVVILRYKNKKILVGRNNYIIERLMLHTGRPLYYKQIDDGFSNPNTVVNMKALDWICRVVEEFICPRDASGSAGTRTDLLEMYCGGGNHTVALSSYFNKIFAVEINKQLCKIAQRNFSLNDRTNIKILACDSAHFAGNILKNLNKYPKDHKIFQAPAVTDEDSEEVEGLDDLPLVEEEPLIEDSDNGEEYHTVSAEIEAEAQALAQPLHHVEVPDETPEGEEKKEFYNFRTVLVDPPRAGLDPFTIRAIQSYDFIIYISCNPVMLLENLKELCKTHTIIKLCVFDHFAYTPHLEVGTVLRKKSLN